MSEHTQSNSAYLHNRIKEVEDQLALANHDAFMLQAEFNDLRNDSVEFLEMVMKCSMNAAGNCSEAESLRKELREAAAKFLTKAEVKS